MSTRHKAVLTMLSQSNGINRQQHMRATFTSNEENHFDYCGLPGLRTFREPEIADDRILIQAEQSTRLHHCPRCGGTLKRNGTRPQVVRDEPRGLRSVWVEVRRQSYRCTTETCGKPVQQPLYGVDEKRRMTTRLLRYTQDNSLLDKFQMVALRTGLSVRTVREIFQEHVCSLDKTFQFRTPRVLGLDGIHIERSDVERRQEPEDTHPEQEKRDRLSRLERGVMTDIEDGQVIDVRKSCSTEEMVQAIKGIPGYEKIEVVVIDMSHALRNAVQKALPQAVIVIDRFHVQRYASDSMDNVRRRLRNGVEEKIGESVMCDKDLLRKHWNKLSTEEQENLRSWFRYLPELGLAYEIKEAYFELWNSPSSVIARKRYQRWLEQLPVEFKDDFKPLLSAMQNWGEYIFNYFEHRYTNAFTEQANRQIRDILRASRTCGFKTYRAKIVYGTMVRKQMEKRRKTWAKDKGTHPLTGRQRRSDARPKKVKKIRLLPVPPPCQISLLNNAVMQGSI
jgi:transposase